MIILDCDDVGIVISMGKIMVYLSPIKWEKNILSNLPIFIKYNKWHVQYMKLVSSKILAL
jgi:hypothetical protein